MPSVKFVCDEVLMYLSRGPMLVRFMVKLMPSVWTKGQLTLRARQKLWITLWLVVNNSLLMGGTLDSGPRSRPHPQEALMADVGALPHAENHSSSSQSSQG